MKTVSPHSIAAALAAALLLCAGIGSAAAETATSVPGESLDSGLGNLAPYSQWSDRTGKTTIPTAIAGQKLDSGLGELPHYSLWRDRSGAVKVAANSRTPTR